jgi:putative intracellular protease/amidase/YHS domain-containing protein
MNRRELLQRSAAVTVAAAVPLFSSERTAATTAAGETSVEAGGAGDAAAPAGALQPPAQGPIPVAFLISGGAVVIDFCGPWQVFENVSVSGRNGAPFRLYTVAESLSPVAASGGLQIVPNFTFATAPAPKVIVIPAQHGAGEAALGWIRRASEATDLTMSVCTGAFLLAKTGLLSGKAATTHHSAYTEFAMQFPDIRVRRGARFVEVGKLATAGGLSSGIDLSLRVVERYFGRAVALQTADYMEYQGQGWTDPNSNEAYRARRVSTPAHPLCPVCDMDVDIATAPHSVYRGQTYYFCMPDHKALFDANPDRFLEALAS